MKLDPRRIEVPDDATMILQRGKSGWEKITMAGELFEFARATIRASVVSQHPAWSEAQVRHEVSRRLLGEAA